MLTSEHEKLRDEVDRLEDFVGDLSETLEAVRRTQQDIQRDFVDGLTAIRRSHEHLADVADRAVVAANAVEAGAKAMSQIPTAIEQALTRALERLTASMVHAQRITTLVVVLVVVILGMVMLADRRMTLHATLPGGGSISSGALVPGNSPPSGGAPGAMPGALQ